MPDRHPIQSEFEPGQPSLSASSLNAIRGAVPTVLTGGKGVKVNKFGGKVVIEAEEQRTTNQQSLMFRTFAVLQQFDDVLLCAPITVGDDLIVHSASIGSGVDPTLRLYIAKPRLLQKSPFNGQVVVLGALSITYTYTGIGARTAAATVSGTPTTENQQVTPDYFVGDIIIARKGRSGLSVDDVPVFWVDLNEGGRQWAKVS